MAYQEQQNLHTNGEDENDSIKEITYQNEYYTHSAKTQKQRKKIDEELSAALASITTGSTKKDKSKNCELQNDEWHNVADSSKSIKKKKSKKDRKMSPTILNGEDILNVTIVNEEIPRKKKKSRKRDFEDDRISMDSYRLEAEKTENIDKDDMGDYVNMIEDVPKKKKSKKNKKLTGEDLIEFEKDHLKKSRTILENNTLGNCARYKKDKQINRLASKMYESMQITS